MASKVIPNLDGTNFHSSSPNTSYTDSFSVSSYLDDVPLKTGSTTPITNNDMGNNDIKQGSYSFAIPTYDKIMEKLDVALNIGIPNPSRQALFDQKVKYYNRFKIPTVDDAFSKGFAHVFFTRPDCNLLSSKDSLAEGIKNYSSFMYAFNKNPNMIRQLSINNAGLNNDFAMFLSNASASFSADDEGIDKDYYGETFNGYKIAYGKSNVEFKTAGTFSIEFDDDRDLHVYNIIKMWVDYIHLVHHGEISPLNINIMNKILDYAASCYYIVTAEDGETIIFWSKYYGIFPVSIPSTQLSWQKGSFITAPSLNVSFVYSFKEDYNPYALAEFNYNARVGSSDMTYIPTYDPNLGHTGTTWVETPYIELCKSSSNNISTYSYKLRGAK